MMISTPRTRTKAIVISRLLTLVFLVENSDTAANTPTITKLMCTARRKYANSSLVNNPCPKPTKLDLPATLALAQHHCIPNMVPRTIGVA